jgi:hypothetical protein
LALDLGLCGFDVVDTDSESPMDSCVSSCSGSKASVSLVVDVSGAESKGEDGFWCQEGESSPMSSCTGSYFGGCDGDEEGIEIDWECASSFGGEAEAETEAEAEAEAEDAFAGMEMERLDMFNWTALRQEHWSFDQPNKLMSYLPARSPLKSPQLSTMTKRRRG